MKVDTAAAHGAHVSWPPHLHCAQGDNTEKISFSILSKPQADNVEVLSKKTDIRYQFWTLQKYLSDADTFSANILFRTRHSQCDTKES